MRRSTWIIQGATRTSACGVRAGQASAGSRRAGCAVRRANRTGQYRARRQLDRAAGKAYVNRLVGNQVREVEVKTGLRNASGSEVISGVQADDVIIVGGVTGLSSLINQGMK